MKRVINVNTVGTFVLVATIATITGCFLYQLLSGGQMIATFAF